VVSKYEPITYYLTYHLKKIRFCLLQFITEPEEYLNAIVVLPLFSDLLYSLNHKLVNRRQVSLYSQVPTHKPPKALYIPDAENGLEDETSKRAYHTFSEYEASMTCWLLSIVVL
jgi:hypothetical protein